MSTNKPIGRQAKRMAFYARYRRKAQGLAVLKQIRDALPIYPLVGTRPSSMLLVRDEWESQTFAATR